MEPTVYREMKEPSAWERMSLTIIPESCLWTWRQWRTRMLKQLLDFYRAHQGSLLPVTRIP